MDLLKIPTLRRLYLNENQLTQIPYEAAISTSLEHLDLDFNRMSAYPQELFMHGIVRLPGPRLTIQSSFLKKKY